VTGWGRAVRGLSAAVLVLGLLAACSERESPPGQVAEPPPLSAERLLVPAEVPGTTIAKRFVVMAGVGLQCPAALEPLRVLQLSLKPRPAYDAVSLTTADERRIVDVGVWNYSPTEASGAPRKQIGQLTRAFDGCTYTTWVTEGSGTAATERSGTAVVESVRVPLDDAVAFRCTARAGSRVIMQIVIVYVIRGSSLLAVQERRIGPAFPVEETVTVTKRALAKAAG
jgi:hypothetical protein